MSKFTAPPFIGRKNLKTFNRLASLLDKNNRDIEQIDMESVGILAVNLDLFCKANNDINKNGAMITTGNVNKKNPWCDLLKEANLAARSGFDSLGMTPASRKKMHIICSAAGETTKGAFDDELNAQ